LYNRLPTSLDKVPAKCLAAAESVGEIVILGGKETVDDAEIVDQKRRSILDNGSDFDPVEFRPPVQEREFDQERSLDNVRADFLQERNGCSGCATCRQQIVDQQHFASWLHRINMNGDRVRTVFQIVRLLVREEGKLAFLANRNKATLQPDRGRGGEYKPTRVDPNHGVDAAGNVILREKVNCPGKEAGVLQDGCDVFELDSWFWKIRDISNSN
jgi:hypothetical protein